MQQEPYSKREIHRTTQAEDMVYNDQQGKLSVARMTALHPEVSAAGFHAELIAAVDPHATPVEAQRGRMGFPAPPPER